MKVIVQDFHYPLLNLRMVVLYHGIEDNEEIFTVSFGSIKPSEIEYTSSPLAGRNAMKIFFFIVKAAVILSSPYMLLRKKMRGKKR